MQERESRQLEYEIQRHYAMAKVSRGAIREDHIRAAAVLRNLQHRIGGDGPRQRSKSVGGLLSLRMSFIKKRQKQPLGKRSPGG